MTSEGLAYIAAYVAAAALGLLRRRQTRARAPCNGRSAGIQRHQRPLESRAPPPAAAGSPRAAPGRRPGRAVATARALGPSPGRALAPSCTRTSARRARPRVSSALLALLLLLLLTLFLPARRLRISPVVVVVAAAGIVLVVVNRRPADRVAVPPRPVGQADHRRDRAARRQALECVSEVLRSAGDESAARRRCARRVRIHQATGFACARASRALVCRVPAGCIR